MRHILAVVVLWVLAAPAFAYVDASLTLGKVVNDAGTITVLKVEKVSKEKRVIIYQKVADLKGKHPAERVHQQLTDGLHPREPRFILDWAEPGKVAVCFQSGGHSLICVGPYWYQCGSNQSHCIMVSGRPDLSLAYSGSTARLREAVAAMLADKEVVIPVRQHGAGVGAYYVAAFREVPRGRDWPLWRVKASLKMPAHTFLIDPKVHVVGRGAAGPEDVPALLKALGSADAAVRREAAEDLALVEPPAKDALPGLARALKDADPAVVAAAAAATLAITPGDAGALTALRDLLADKDVRARKAAAAAVGDAGPAGRAAVPALAAALKDADADVRMAAAESLGRVGPHAETAVSPLVEALKDPRTRIAAVEALGGIGPKAQAAVPALTEILRPQGQVDWVVVRTLLRIGGPGAKAAAPPMIEALRQLPPNLQSWDLRLLLTLLGPEEGKDAVPYLVKQLNDGDYNYITVLTNIDPRAAIPFMLNWAKKHGIHAGHTEILVRLGAEAVPALAKEIATKSSPLRKYACETLGRMGPAAKEALPTLTLALAKEESWIVRMAAARAMMEIAGVSAEVFAVFGELLKDADGGVRSEAAIFLAGLGPKAKPLAPALAAALEDVQVWVRVYAAIALVRIGGPEAPAGMALLAREVEKCDHTHVRRFAADALLEAGPAAAKAAPALTKALQDSDAGVRSKAAYALVRLGTLESKDALPILIAALQGKCEPYIRAESARFLSGLGPAAAGAVPALTTALKDDNEQVRGAAAEALKRIPLHGRNN